MVVAGNCTHTHRVIFLSLQTINVFTNAQQKRGGEGGKGHFPQKTRGI